MCFTPFTEAAVKAGRRVTLEHVPPKALGGRIMCLTCRTCNAGTGRVADQLAARQARTRFPVTVDILGKKDTFMLSPEGKELTPAFGGFTKVDFENLGKSGGRFTMSIPVADPHLVAVSSIKSAYLALFSLFGPVGGYDFVGGKSLADVRRLLLEPGRYAKQLAGKYVHRSPKEMKLEPEGRPEPDIFLVTEPHACWIVRVHDHHVFLPLESNGDESAPLSDWYRKRLGGREAKLVANPCWMFQEFGVSRAISVHLAGADDLENPLIGLEITGKLPDGKQLNGVCVSHVGESAVVLCDS